MKKSAFGFVDRVTEVKPNESLTAFFKLEGDEEFLKDHFDGFPVMPGVLMLESLKQAAAALLGAAGDPGGPFYRLREVSGVRFGQFVKPGSEIRLFVRLREKRPTGFFFEGRIDLLDGRAALRALTADFSLVKVENIHAK